VAPDRLRFDFNGAALTPGQIAEIETRVNEKITAGEDVYWFEREHSEVKGRKDVMQFFGDKYGDKVRVVQIGGERDELNGYSMELCGGTHVRNTKDIGLFKIRSEGAIAAGIRRVEAVCGDAAIRYMEESLAKLKAEHDLLEQRLEQHNRQLGEAGADSVKVPEIDQAWVASFMAMAEHSAEQKQHTIVAFEERNELVKKAVAEADKRLKKAKTAAQAGKAAEWLKGLIETANAGDGAGPPVIVENFEDCDPGLLQELLNGLKKEQFGGVAVMTLSADGNVNIGIFVASTLTGDFQAGKLMGQLAPIVGGRGGGKPEMARGAGPDGDKIPALLKMARELLGG
jgi:alanyl-tRNA synthetase